MTVCLAIWHDISDRSSSKEKAGKSRLPHKSKGSCLTILLKLYLFFFFKFNNYCTQSILQTRSTKYNLVNPLFLVSTVVVDMNDIAILSS